MSGHSKWATIKRAKAANDAKRGNIFTKHANNITIAAKEGGGDLETNFKLRLAVDRAKNDNVPKDNIERAIKRGTGELGGETIEEVMYGAMLPGQTALIVKCLTDNKNRSVTEVKTAITKNGGQYADLSSVAWQFENKGVIKTEKPETNEDEVEMSIMESGALDYEIDEDITLYTKPEDLQKVKNTLENLGFKIISADLEMVSKEKKEVSDDELGKISKIIDALDELDDVSSCYTNVA